MSEMSTDDWFVVINPEEQYSIWPARRPVPDGWEPVGEAGTKDACLDRIEVLWTDMRPRSLRERMARSEASPAT